MHASKTGSYLGALHDEVPAPQTAVGDEKVRKDSCLNGKSSLCSPVLPDKTEALEGTALYRPENWGNKWL